MKNQRSVGLVVEGSSTASLVLRLPNIVEDLGPIKAGSLRVARRFSNFLRAGHGVSNYEDLQPARLILLRIPDAAAPRIVDELCSSELVFKELSFVLCESCQSSSILKPLQTLGASVASLTPVQTIRQSWFVIEGQLTAVRQGRRFLERNNARAFELRPGTKPLYFAAQMLATALPASLYAAAQQALREAGISGNHLRDLLEEMSLEMFRTFANGARLTSPIARLGCPSEVADEYLNYLRSQHPHVAEAIDQQLALAMRLNEIKAPA